MFVGQNWPAGSNTCAVHTDGQGSTVLSSGLRDMNDVMDLIEGIANYCIFAGSLSARVHVRLLALAGGTGDGAGARPHLQDQDLLDMEGERWGVRQGRHVHIRTRRRGPQDQGRSTYVLGVMKRFLKFLPIC